MSKLIGRIGWELQPGYPELSGDDGAEQITERWIVHRNEIAQIPEPGTFYSSATHDFFNLFPKLRLRSRTVRPMTGGKTYEVTLVYAYPPGMEPPGDTQVYEACEYNTQEFDAPINQHPDYKIEWDHAFWVKKGEESSEDVSNILYSTREAKTNAIPSSGAGKCCWIKDGEKAPDGYGAMTNVQKPGVTSFRTGVATVTQTYKSTSKAKLKKKIADDFKIGAPKETFGATGAWLRGGSQMRKESRYWTQVVTYTNSKQIDTDIYKNA